MLSRPQRLKKPSKSSSENSVRMSDAKPVVVSMVGKSSETRNVARREKFILVSKPYGHCITRYANHCGRAILAITKANIDALPTLFRTYDTSDSLKDCAIWEVARATSAATTFFKSIKCGRDEVEFVDAGFGYNNPCEVLLREARSIFAGVEFGCILSIGTGIGNVLTVGATRKSILDALKAMAASSQKVAQRLNELYSNEDVYFRFNVPRGLEDVTLSDWKDMSNISAHTRNYLAESQSPLAKCSIVLQQNSTAARAAENKMPSGES